MKLSRILTAAAAVTLLASPLGFVGSSQAATYDSVCMARWNRLEAAHAVPKGMTFEQFMARPACPTDFSSAITNDEDGPGSGSLTFEDGHQPAG